MSRAYATTSADRSLSSFSRSTNSREWCESREAAKNSRHRDARGLNEIRLNELTCIDALVYIKAYQHLRRHLRARAILYIDIVDTYLERSYILTARKVVAASYTLSLFFRPAIQALHCLDEFTGENGNPSSICMFIASSQPANTTIALERLLYTWISIFELIVQVCREKQDDERYQGFSLMVYK